MSTKTAFGTTEAENGTTTLPTPHSNENQAALKALIVLIATVALLVFLGGVLVMFVRKKKLDRLRHKLIPHYSYDPREDGDDWETELLDDTSDLCLKGYKSTNQSNRN